MVAQKRKHWNSTEMEQFNVNLICVLYCLYLFYSCLSQYNGKWNIQVEGHELFSASKNLRTKLKKW